MMTTWVCPICSKSVQVIRGASAVRCGGIHPSAQSGERFRAMSEVEDSAVPSPRAPRSRPELPERAAVEDMTYEVL